MYDTTNLQHKQDTLKKILFLGSISVLVLSFLSISSGAVKLSLKEVIESIRSIIRGDIQSNASLIIYYIRLPRTISVILVGIGLSLSGVIMQAIMKNPLADPYITGISSGSVFGAVLILFWSEGSFSIPFILPIAAFSGAILSFLIMLQIIKIVGETNTNLILSGIIVGIFFSALTVIIIVLGENDNRTLYFWLFGSFAYIGWDEVTILSVFVIPITAILFLHAPEMNAISMGETNANELGINYKNFRKYLIIAVSFLTAISVAFTGIIGFIGLIVPHVSRMIVGADHRVLLPMSIFGGACILLIADIIVRIAVPPLELPIGAIMALLGAPFFIYLMFVNRREYFV